MSSPNNLLDPIVDQGILHTNFFEGRLLTARDLRDQQEANRERARRLGRAIGEGIIEGLEVEVERDGSAGEVPVVTVKRGLALNRDGEIIGLPERDVQVALSRSIEATPTTEADFYACAGPPITKYLANGAGVYVVVMSPAAGFKERAPKSGLGDEGVVKGCGSRYVQEGVRFRLVELERSLLTTLEGVSENLATLLVADLLSDSNPPTKDDAPRLSRLRSLLAHLCLGTDRLTRAVTDPASGGGTPLGVLEAGAIGAMRSSGELEDCDVPLALIYWTLSGVAFHDLWSVRRLAAESNIASAPLAAPVLSSIRQFQEQLSGLEVQSDLEVEEYFLYLPPVGMLPTRDPRYGSSSGYELRRFFGARRKRLTEVIDARQTSALLTLAASYPPAPVADIEEVGTYYVAQQLRASLQGGESQLYAYFCLPEVGHRFCSPARFMGADTELSQGDLRSLYEACRFAYQEFRRIALLYGLDSEAQVTREDILGIEVIDQVLAAVSSALAGVDSRCTGNDVLYRAFRRVAGQEQYFALLWRDLVLVAPNGDRYRSEIHDLISQLGHLADDMEYEGFRGLLPALADHDVVSAYMTQQRINQAFSLTIGTGARGVITLDYSAGPVALPEEGGDEVPILEPGDYVFGFTLNARISEQSTFILTTSIVAFGWTEDLLGDSGSEPRPSDRLVIPKSDHIEGGLSYELRVLVRVPAGGDGTAVLVFRIEEEAGGGGVPPANEEISLEIGDPIPLPDKRVSVMLTSLGDGTTAATPVDGGISIPRTYFTAISFGIRSDVPGRFSATIEPEDERDWDMLDLSGTPENFGSDTAPFNEVLSLGMRPGESAASTDLILTVSSRADSDPAVDQPVLERFRLPVIIRDNAGPG